MSSPSFTSTTSTPATNPSIGTPPADLLDDIFYTSRPASPILGTENDVQLTSSSQGGTSTPSTSLQSREPSDIPRLRATHTTAGYRDGIALAREAAVQPGFDEGYVLGSAIGIRVGYLIGVMEGLSEALKKSTEVNLEAISTEMHKDFAISKLMGPDYINPDGTWSWSVGAMDGDEGPTSREVANAHPLILKWRSIVRRYTIEAGIARELLFREPRDAGIGARSDIIPTSGSKQTIVVENI